MNRIAGHLLALAVVAGCAGGPSGTDGGDAEPTAPREETPATVRESATAAALPAACTLVPRRSLERFASGSWQKSLPHEVGGLVGCRHELSGSSVQVVSVPAAVWAERLPALMDLVEDSGMLPDAESREKFAAARERIKAGRPVRGPEACALFSELLGLQGMGPGAHEVVNYVPGAEQPQAVNGQICTHGTYTSVQLVSGRIDGSAAEVRRTEEVLRAAHRTAREN